MIKFVADFYHLKQYEMQNYDTLAQQIASLVADEHDETGVLANVAAALHDSLGHHWIGFYLMRGDTLMLGPFQGPVACYRIGRGKGVCGHAAETRQTVVVPDVEQFPGHIACSSLSRSEIVIPLKDAQGEVRAVLDIDSTQLDAFSETDRLGLERIADIVAKQIYYVER